MARRCSICVRHDASNINEALVTPRTSLRSIAVLAKVSPMTMRRHRDLCLPDISAKLLEVRAQVQDVAEAIDLGVSLEMLLAEAARDRERALERGDYRLALRAVDTLLRGLELQQRLTLQAAQQRASDVSRHPVWHRLCARIIAALLPYPEASAAVSAEIQAILR